jgi:hypothetical protein
MRMNFRKQLRLMCTHDDGSIDWYTVLLLLILEAPAWLTVVALVYLGLTK